MTEFQKLAQAMSLKTDYEENVRHLHVHRKHRSLTIDSAKWFLSNAPRSNRPSQLLDAMKAYCSEYLDIANKRGKYVK